MRRRIIVSAAAVVLTCGVLSAGAAPATADASCQMSDFSPHSTVVGLSPRIVKFSVKLTGCDLDHWSLDSGERGGGFFVSNTASTSWSFWAESNIANSEAGSATVVTEVWQTDGTETHNTFTNGWDLKRATHWNHFNASPEPINSGAKLSIAGQLMVADWNADKYVGYAGHSVSIEFRTPNGKYKAIRKVKTGKGGWVRSTVTAKATGVWRVAYGGTTVAGSSVAEGDAVKVSG